MKNLFTLSSLVTALLLSSHAVAASPRAILDIYEGTSTTATWSEDVSGLLVLNAGSGNFSLLSGDASHGYFQSGAGLLNTAPNTAGANHPDYWTWTTDTTTNTGYWSWQSMDGSAVAELHAASGLGDPKVDLEFTVKNNSANTRTYTFRESEDFTSLSAPSLISAQFNASVKNPAGSSVMSPITGHALQELYLHDSNGATVNANANLGGMITFDSAHPAYSDLVTGVNSPMGNWNHMELVSRFTLSGYSDKIRVNGWATITPVPEADTSAMLLAGLLMVGLVTRRRKQAD